MPTVLHRLHDWAQLDPAAPAQRYKDGDQWRTITARDFLERVFHLALFMESKGISAGDTSAIFSYNCPQWVHVDLATLLLGARSAGIYPNSPGKEIHYILNHTQAAVLAVQNRDYYQRVVDGGPGVPPTVRLILSFDGDTSFSPLAVSYEAALQEGRKLAKEKRLNTYLNKVDKEAGAFLIYTSGTTGDPKGALLSHDNLAFTSDMVIRHWKIKPGEGRLLSFLPLCHIAEKLQNLGLGLSLRYTVYFASKFENVAKELGEVQPTGLLCVPRLWEKMMEGVKQKVGQSQGAQKKLATWALEVGARVAEARYSGRQPDLADLVQHRLADKLVLSKIRKTLGLSEAHTVASGAAALPRSVAVWFRSIGVEILEDFGQTESTGVICMTERRLDCAGAVGRPVPGIEFKLGEDGELLTRGRHVFKGYYQNDQATADTVVDGWLHTGDLGEIDDRGLIKVVGRKKEIMKTSGGKMIAPVPIEEEIRESPLISQAVLVGDGRKYFTALVVLAESVQSALKQGAVGADGMRVIDAKILEDVRAHIDEVNGKLGCYEQIKHFAVLAKDFSVEDGELTPTLKMKRNVIEKRYKPVIEWMYQEIADSERKREDHNATCPLICSPELCVCKRQGVKLEIVRSLPARESRVNF